MQELFNTFIQTTSSLITCFIYFIPPIFIWIIKTYIPKKIDSRINISLQEKKSEFTKLEYNAQLYCQTQHKVFHKLSNLLLIAHSNVINMRGVHKKPLFYDMTKDDIKIYLKSEIFLNSTKDEILSLWEHNKQKAIDILNRNLELTQLIRIENSMIKARNYLFKKQIYVPDDIFNMSLNILNDCHELYIYYSEPPYKYPNQDIDHYTKKTKELRDGLELSITNLTQSMKNYLKRGTI